MHFISVLLNLTYCFVEIYERERIYMFWLGWQPIVVLFKPETIEVKLFEWTINLSKNLKRSHENHIFGNNKKLPFFNFKNEAIKIVIIFFLICYTLGYLIKPVWANQIR